MRYTIKRGTTSIATVRPTGTVTDEIMGREEVAMDFALPQMVAFKPSDYVEIEGRHYFLATEPQAEKVNSRHFKYSLQFFGIKYELAKVQFFSPDSQNKLTVSDFSPIADANTIIDLIVQNANRIQSGWAKGTVVTTEAKQIDFSGDNCLSALAKLAEAHDLEYWVDGNKSIHFEERKKISGYTFEYGKAKGLKSITRTPLDNSNIVTRLYVTGGEKNIPANYRNYSKNLKMPVPYLEKNTTKYGIIEHTQPFLEIYPKRIGTVTAVNADNPLQFTDAAIDFDLNQTDANGTVILIANVPAKLKFNSGQLAGYTFELQHYETNSKTFYILKNTDEKDIEVPSTLLRPAVGDKYVLFDVKMPQAYITAAEVELQTAAQKYLDENCEQRNTYDLITDANYFKAQNVSIKIGNTIHAQDLDFALDANLRVIATTKKLENLFAIELTLAEKATIATIVRAYIEKEKQNTSVKKLQKYNAEMARRSYNFAKEIQDNVFDGEGYFDAKKIKPLSIDTKMLSVGSRMQQLNLKNVVLQVLNNNTTVTNTAGELIHLTIADTPRTWQVPAAAQMNIATGFHYIYAKAQRVGTNASIFISPNQIAVEADATYYHFEIGYLGSIENGFRRIKTTYGFTQVSPGEITTGRIASANGQQYIDLLQDRIDINANVTFSSYSPALAQVATQQDSKILAAQTNAKNYTDAIEVGGRNLLRNSGDYIKNSNYLIATYSLTKGIDNGKTYTIEIRGKLHVEKSSFLVYNSVGSGGAEVTILKTDFINGVYRKTFIAKTKERINNSILIYTASSSVVRESEIESIMLVEGSKTNGWSLAPEDVQANIDKAKQEAEAASNGYALAKVNLAETTAKAYADGKVSAEEQRAIADATNKANDAKAHAESKDVALKLLTDQYADLKKVEAKTEAIEVAKNYTDAVEVGTANLINSSSEILVISGKTIFDFTDYKAGDEFIITIGSVERLVAGLENGNNSFAIDGYRTFPVGVEKYSYKFKIASPTSKLIFHGSANWSGRSVFKEVILTRGNKIVDWHPSTADVQANINQAKQEAINKAIAAQAEALNAQNTANVAKALAETINPKTAHLTNISGNVVMTGTQLFRNATQITGGITGVVDATKDNVADWRGLGIDFANRHTAPYRLTHDGKLYALDAVLRGSIEASEGKIGDISITPKGLGANNGVVSLSLEGNNMWLDADGLTFTNTTRTHVVIDGVARYRYYTTKTTITAQGVVTTTHTVYHNN